MSSTDGDQVSGTVGGSQPSGEVAASQVGGTVGARLAQPQANLWTPAELGSDLALWLDRWGSSFQTRTNNGVDYVEVWGDRSGNVNDATQATGSEQPQLFANAVSFNNEDYLISPAINGEYDIYTILDTNDDNWVLPVGADKGANSRGFSKYGIVSEDGANSSFISQYDSLGEVRKNANKVTPTTFGEVDSLFTIDTPVLLGQMGAKISNWNVHILGIYAPSGSIYKYTGKIIGHLVVKSGVERRRVEGWAAHAADRELGITEPLNNLPSSHPYSDSPPTV